MDHEVSGEQNDVRLRRVCCADDTAKLVHAVERGPDVQVCQDRSTHARQGRRPARYREPVLPDAKRRGLEPKPPRAEEDDEASEYANRTAVASHSRLRRANGPGAQPRAARGLRLLTLRCRRLVGCSVLSGWLGASGNSSPCTGGTSGLSNRSELRSARRPRSARYSTVSSAAAFFGNGSRDKLVDRDVILLGKLPNLTV